jgi:hypothetical protein
MKKMLLTFFEIHSTRSNSHRTHYVELLKPLREAVPIKMPEFWPNDLILRHESAPAQRALSVKQFLAQKSITEMEHPPHSPDLAPNNC